MQAIPGEDQQADIRQGGQGLVRVATWVRRHHHAGTEALVVVRRPTRRLGVVVTRPRGPREDHHGAFAPLEDRPIHRFTCDGELPTTLQTHDAAHDRPPYAEPGSLRRHER